MQVFRVLDKPVLTVNTCKGWGAGARLDYSCIRKEKKRNIRHFITSASMPHLTVLPSDSSARITASLSWRIHPDTSSTRATW